ncbi:MAG TPA: hypothetical protein VK209_10445 [Candidatus Sulfotelmatobacter sp.]|nr:hypothetical protein [Candidatus Sulfotelmatobacter sp.]
MSAQEKEFTQFGEVLSKLTANREAFKSIFEALEKKDAKNYRAQLRKLNLLRYCRIICRWYCHLHCVRFLRRICIEPPIELKEVEDMRKLSEAHAKIMVEKEVRDSLFEAYEKENVERFQTTLKKYNLLPFCWYIVQWLCWYHCERRCYIVCTPPYRFP